MPRRAWLLAVVLVVSALAVPVAFPPDATDSAAAQAGPRAGEPCDYAALYDETVDSVVRVGRDGGQGSGFVYDASAANGTSYVVTNEHVVGEAGTVTVTFRDGEYRTGEVVGRDAYADLAVVRVDDAPDYALALPVADAMPETGQPVAAIGTPFGLEGSITHGIVSGTNRSMPTDRGFAIPDVIQTDAPINPGNSGGPLLDCDGTVVGVNTAGIQAFRADNVGFAVSSSLIRRVAPELIETGEVTWPYLGVRTADVTPAVAEANGLDAARGVAVVETVEGGPAAGVLQPAEEVRTGGGQPVPVGGDVVVGVDGRRVDTGEDLSSYLATEAVPGETVTLTVVRDGERRRVAVTLGERPRPPASGGP